MSRNSRTSSVCPALIVESLSAFRTRRLSGVDFAGSRNAAVLGVYAEQDARVNATRDAAARALESAGLTHEIVTYPDAGHAFFNDTGARYSQAAAAAAYQKLLGWFGDHLG